VESPPQATSMTFNELGECTELTGGYIMDKNIGNTGGLGGVFGMALHGVHWSQLESTGVPFQLSLGVSESPFQLSYCVR